MTPEQTAKLDALETANQKFLAERNAYLLGGAQSATLDQIQAELDKQLQQFKDDVAAIDTQLAADAAQQQGGADRAAAIYTGVKDSSGAYIQPPSGVNYTPVEE